ncbi:MAG TPA: signal recognition particle-docking protein FtsY [Rhizobiaceae bacterium]|nr:signal recognition particle-docking protein FtsY [Rhizobiaceae bacterium]
MAFGFIKKVFSFGKKEVEERPAEDAPLKPLNFDALEALKSSEPAKPEEGAPAPEPPHPVEPQPEPEPRPDVPEPTPEPEIPAPGPDLPPPEEEPALPEPGPELPEPPAPSEIPEQPEPPSPIEPAPAPERPGAKAPPPEAMVELGPAQTRQIPETPETPKRPSVDEAPPTHAAPEPDQPFPAPAFSPDIPVPEKPAKPSEAPEPSPEIPAPIEPPDEPQPANREPASGETAPHPPAGAFSPLAGRTATSPDAEAPLSPSLRDKDKGEARSAEPDRPEAGQAPATPESSAGRVTVSKKVEQKAEPEKAPESIAAPRQSWFQRMRAGLSRSSRELSSNIAGIFTKRKLDEDALQDLEDVLIRADLGVEAAMRITDTLASGRYGKDISDVEVRRVMAVEVEKVLAPVALPLELDLSYKPHVILVVGVNGTGKTTTIGKLAAKLTAGGLSVMLAAGDTFRAAAIEQLKIWGERTHSPVVASKLGADAAGLAFDAFQQAKEAGSDVLIIDTAGRLQNKAELMAELEKIVRVLGRLDPEAPHTVLQTIDATTGQNALNQVEIFRNVAGVNGLVLTKLDGTARGGILVAIAAKHKLPVYFIGVGEQVDDLEPFSAKEFAEAIAGTG